MGAFYKQDSFLDATFFLLKKKGCGVRFPMEALII